MATTLHSLLVEHRAGRSYRAFAADLAAGGCDVGDVNLWRWETGDVTPSLDSLRRLADALGLSAGQRLDLFDAVALSGRQEAS